MPANEQTWRNIPLLHRVFAISGVAMFVATIWVFWADQNREWRTTQQQVAAAAKANAAWDDAAQKLAAAEKSASAYLELRNAAKSESDENVVAAGKAAETANQQALAAEAAATEASRESARLRDTLVT